MKIPIIKHLVDFVENNDEDFIHETIEVLESLADVPTLKDEELDVIGELISNMYGAIEVQKEISKGSCDHQDPVKLLHHRQPERPVRRSAHHNDG